MSSVNRMFSFSIYMHFIFLAFFFLAKTSSMMLNKSGKRVHPCLHSHLREKAFNLSPLSKILVVGLL